MTFRSTRALFAKEWSQHRRAIVVLTAFYAVIGIFTAVAALRATRMVSVLEIVPRLAITALPTAALILGHRLLVAEYYGRTQRFLEALPMRRGEEAVVKATVGLLCTWFWALALLALVLIQVRAHEPVDVRFVAVLATRLGGYTLAMWALIFLFNVCGRLRWPILIVVFFIALLAVNTETNDLRYVGVFRLIQPETFAVERRHVPWGALFSGLALAGGSFALAMALVAVRDGSILETLAKPASNREKAAFLIVVMGAIAAVALSDKPRVVPLPALTSDENLRPDEGLEVVYVSAPLRPAAQRLVTLLNPALRQMRAVLPAPAPRLRIIHAGDVPADRTEPEMLTHHERATIVRVNLTLFAPDVANDDLEEQRLRVLADVFHASLSSATEGRALIEPRHWWTDGFAQFLAARSLPLGVRLTERNGLFLHAQSGGVAPNLATVTQYHTFSEQVGESRAMALSGAGWLELHRQLGEDRLFALAKALFAQRRRRDVRDLLHDRWHSPAAVLTTTTGLDLPTFVAHWRQQLQQRTAESSQAFDLGHQPRAAIAVVAQNAAAFDPVVVEANFQASLPPDARCQVRHKLERWFDAWPAADLLQSDEVTLKSDRRSFRHPVDGDYESGERVFVAVECAVPHLPGPIRLHAQRVTVP